MIAPADQSDPRAAAAAELLDALLRAADVAGIVPLLKQERLLWSAAEVGELCNLSERFVQALALAGDLPSVCIGARRLFSPSCVREWIAAGCPHDHWTAANVSKRAEREATADKSARKRRSKAAD